MDDWIAYLEAEPKSEPFLSIAAAWKADKARLASVERERDEIMAMAERRDGELQARLAEVESERATLISVVASARERAEHAEALLRIAVDTVESCHDCIRISAPSVQKRIDAFLTPDSASVCAECGGSGVVQYRAFDGTEYGHIEESPCACQAATDQPDATA